MTEVEKEVEMDFVLYQLSNIKEWETGRDNEVVEENYTYEKDD